MKCKRNNRGFVALMSAVIMSAVLLMVAASSSLVSFYSRFNMLDAELKERSTAVADACADMALVRLAQNTDPNGMALSLNALDECRISTVVGTTQKTFKIQATSSNAAVTNLKIVADSDDLSVISWQEIANY